MPFVNLFLMLKVKEFDMEPDKSVADDILYQAFTDGYTQFETDYEKYNQN